MNKMNNQYILALLLLLPLSLNAMGTIGEITMSAALIDVQKNKIVSRVSETCWSLPLKGEGEATTQGSRSTDANTPSLSLENMYQDPNKEASIHFVCVIREPSCLCCPGGTSQKSIQLPPNGSTQMPYTNKFTLQFETTSVE
jgi:hypothetical protein